MQLYNVYTSLASQETELKICEYVEKNPGTTINQVADHMTKNGICSRMTTLKKIDDLKSRERQILEDKQEGNSFHQLYINTKNEFNHIDNELSKIESIINKMKKNIQIVKANDKKGYVGRFQAFGDFFFPYSESIDIMLRVLSIQINDKIQSDKDLQILYTKIIRLMSKVGIFPYDMKQLIQRLDINVLGLRNLQNYPKFEDCGIDISLRNDLITKIEYFKKEFLLKE